MSKSTESKKILDSLSSFNEDQEVQKNLTALSSLGGIKGVANLLKTDLTNGLLKDASNIEQRRNFFGKNAFPSPPSDSWMDMFLESFQDTTIIILVIAAAVSLVVGLYEDPVNGWIEGTAIVIAVLLVAIVTATNNYNKESQFRKLNAVKDDVSIGVVREGESFMINTKELVVGDVVILNAGDKVPADGVLIDGSDVSCNESALTGESDDKKKKLDDDVFFISGSTLSTGYCHMLVTAVGEQSRWGKTRAKLAVETNDTPLQEKLDVLAKQIGNLGMGTAAATFIVMIVMWIYRPESREEGKTIYDYVLKAFIMAVTIVVVAVPEGLPLAVTLSLSFSSSKMMQDMNLIRVLEACETMGNATNICSDKTGTLTQNRMTVVEGFIGGKHYKASLPMKNDLPQIVVQYIVEGIAINSTANVTYGKGVNGAPIVDGSKTEGALLMLIKNQFDASFSQYRTIFNAQRGDQLITFSSARKCMSVVLVNAVDKKGGISYTKGAAEIILAKCNKFTDENGNEKVLTQAIRDEFSAIIYEMATNALRTIAIAHRHFTNIKDYEESFNDLEKDLTIDAIFGIKDPLRPDVKDSVRQCQEAGIFVRMVTGDNIDTAKAIARECNILTDGGIAMEGPEFRRLSPKEMDAILPYLQVLARSSPSDKHTLVTRLNGASLPANQEEWEEAHPAPGYLDEWKQSRKDGVGEVVGVTGDGTNDGPALKAADVGLSMGLSGTDVAKEASDIVILDDNFSSIVKSVMWGRSVFDNIRKFLQFQLTVNVVALTLTFVSALTGYEPPLNAVMMLWVNLIMDTMGALALGTEQPSTKLLQRKPYKRNASLISNRMLRANDFHVNHGSIHHITIIFNTFVFCQVFNEINARSIGNDVNVFKGLFTNHLFISIIIFTVIAQYGIVTYGGDFVKTTPLTDHQWFKCISLGGLSLPLGALMRFIPIQDSNNDYAYVTKLMIEVDENNKKEMRNEKNYKNKRNDSSLLSLLFYIATIGVICSVTYNEFHEDWIVHINHFIIYVNEWMKNNIKLE
eukprot:gene4934-6902_t